MSNLSDGKVIKSLRKIALEIKKDENNTKDEENFVKEIYKKFYEMLEVFDVDKQMLKSGNSYKFNESEAEFIKWVIKQHSNKDGQNLRKALFHEASIMDTKKYIKGFYSICQHNCSSQEANNLYQRMISRTSLPINQEVQLIKEHSERLDELVYNLETKYFFSLLNNDRYLLLKLIRSEYEEFTLKWSKLVNNLNDERSEEIYENSSRWLDEIDIGTEKEFTKQIYLKDFMHNKILNNPEYMKLKEENEQLMKKFRAKNGFVVDYINILNRNDKRMDEIYNDLCTQLLSTEDIEILNRDFDRSEDILKKTEEFFDELLEDYFVDKKDRMYNHFKSIAAIARSRVFFETNASPF